VVVDVDPGVAPLGAFVARGGEWAQERPVELLEERAAGDAEVPHGPGVEPRQQRPDRGVQLGEAEELAIAQHRQDPALRHEHIGLDDGLVPGMSGPGGHHGGAVVLGELEVRRLMTGS